MINESIDALIKLADSDRRPGAALEGIETCWFGDYTRIPSRSHPALTFDWDHRWEEERAGNTLALKWGIDMTLYTISVEGAEQAARQKQKLLYNVTHPASVAAPRGLMVFCRSTRNVAIDTQVILFRYQVAKAGNFRTKIGFTSAVVINIEAETLINA